MRKWTAIALVAAASLSAAAVLTAQAAWKNRDSISGIAIVTDGDSLRIGGARIRIMGIDAPERTQICRDADGKASACGQEAADHLRLLVAGEYVTCIPTPKQRDRYRRTVATCSVSYRRWMPPIDIGEAMVRSGYAMEYTRYSGGRYAVVEADAKNRRRGIWAGDFEPPNEWRKRKQ